jgi:hypothetical protein
VKLDKDALDRCSACKSRAQCGSSHSRGQGPRPSAGEFSHHQYRCTIGLRGDNLRIASAHMGQKERLILRADQQARGAQGPRATCTYPFTQSWR